MGAKPIKVGDGLLADTDIEEALSEAIVGVIAARAGYSVAKSDFDRSGIDLTIEAGGQARPKIDVQVKATITASEKDGLISFKLKRRNYDLLRLPTITPRLLLLVLLPKSKSEWLATAHDQTVLKRAAYWLSLRGAPEVTNSSTVTVKVPAANLLTIQALKGLMNKSRTGTLS